MKNDFDAFTEKVGNRLIKNVKDLSDALECSAYNRLLPNLQVAVTNLPKYLGDRAYEKMEKMESSAWRDFSGVKASPMISPNLLFDLGSKIISYPFVMSDFIEALEAGHEYGCRCLYESEAKGDWVNGVTDKYEVDLIKPRGDLSKRFKVRVSVRGCEWTYSSHDDNDSAESHRQAILTRFLDWKEEYPATFDQWDYAEAFLEDINITAEVIEYH